jgi:hypothetical protein
VLFGTAGLYLIFSRRLVKPLPLILSGVCALLVIAPWAYLTWQEYGEPFFSYTKYYSYNFAWSVHNFDHGNTSPGQFFTLHNLPSILRVKLKALLIVFFYSTMILGLPLTIAFLHGLKRVRPPEIEKATAPSHETEGNNDSQLSIKEYGGLCVWLFAGFLIATLVQINDVTQVQQLGRYYLPVYVLMLPVVAAGLLHWSMRRVSAKGLVAILLISVGALWSNPSWAHDASWIRSPFQLRWPALVSAGEWIRSHPEEVPIDARVLTWFPWETRVTSNRSTVLFPRALEGGAYELSRLEDTIRRYRVTHVLWGSFEPSLEGDPEALGSYLQSLRESMGLSQSRLLWRSDGFPFPVRLYKLNGAKR